MRTKELGFDRENIVTVELANKNKGAAFANEVAKLSGVEAVSLTRSSPISNDHWWNGMSLTKGSEGKTVCAIYGDEHFFSLFGLKLLHGRIPSGASGIKGQGTNRVVVNEKLLLDLGFGTPNEAVGKHFWWGGDTEIAGVVADFHIEPLHYEIRPTLIAQDTSVYDHLSIRLAGGPELLSTIAAIEGKWKKTFPDGIFELKFLDAEINSFYKLETKLHALFEIFAGMAIVISCLGLWGLITFVAERRTKEVGIRKILGASVLAIVRLLSREFVFVVVIAFGIGASLSRFVLNFLLENFAYRVDIGFGVYIITGFIVVAIALVTVSFQSVKAALVDPVKSLRSE